jgi:hypothetical protein
MHGALRNKRTICSGCKLTVKAHHSMIEGFVVESSHHTNFYKVAQRYGKPGLKIQALVTGIPSRLTERPPLEVFLGTRIKSRVPVPASNEIPQCPSHRCSVHGAISPGLGHPNPWAKPEPSSTAWLEQMVGPGQAGTSRRVPATTYA